MRYFFVVGVLVGTCTYVAARLLGATTPVAFVADVVAVLLATAAVWLAS